jgi:TatD DNase family protein
MTLFDTHTHFDGLSPADFYEEGRAAGVKYMLVAGSDYATACEAKIFSEHIPNSWFSAGAHPHDARDADPDAFDAFFSHKKNAAAGEIGLDYYYDFSEREKQISVFKSFLGKALEHNLPAVVHCRDKDGSQKAYEDAHEILCDFSKSGGKFVMHCFAGDEFWLEKFLSIGSYIGFAGILTFSKGENVRALLRKTPLERILFETDSPYLAPAPFRGKKNHPALLVHTVKKAAEILSSEFETLAEISTRNAFTLFKKASRDEI